MKEIGFKKQIAMAMLIALGYVLQTFVSFPRMSPFQHMINVIGAVILGPIPNLLCAFLTGGLRMILNGSSVLAIIGAVVGATLCAVLYKLTCKLYMAVIGEIIGTGIISAIISYPVMVSFYGLPKASVFMYVPFFSISSAMGAFIGYILIKYLDTTGNLEKIKKSLQK